MVSQLATMATPQQQTQRATQQQQTQAQQSPLTDLQSPYQPVRLSSSNQPGAKPLDQSSTTTTVMSTNTYNLRSLTSRRLPRLRVPTPFPADCTPKDTTTSITDLPFTAPSLLNQFDTVNNAYNLFASTSTSITSTLSYQQPLRQDKPEFSTTSAPERPEQPDFVLSDHFAASHPQQPPPQHQQQQIDTHQPQQTFTKEERQQLQLLHSLLFGTDIDNTSASSHSMPSSKSSGPITPPNGGVAMAPAAIGTFATKPSGPEFDPLSFLNDFDSVGAKPTFDLPSAVASGPFLAKAFQAYRGNSGDTSPMLTPFVFDDNDTPPVHTPALEADDDVLLTSPAWSDFAGFNLFPNQVQGAESFSNTQNLFSTFTTISPKDLDLPLPGVNSNGKRPASPPLVPVAEAGITPSQVAINDAFLACLSRSSSSRPVKRSRLSEVSTPAQSGRESSVPFNGTRNTSLPPVPVDAPTQARTYHGPPSKTSKRDIPAAATKKVLSLLAKAETTGEDTTQEIEKSIEEKRRQNTVAARRSRQRKAEHLAQLEELVERQRAEIERLQLEKEAWMARAFSAGWTESARSL